MTYKTSTKFFLLLSSINYGKALFPYLENAYCLRDSSLNGIGGKINPRKKRLKLIALLGKKNEGLKEAEKGNEGKIFPFGLLLSFFC